MPSRTQHLHSCDYLRFAFVVAERFAAFAAAGATVKQQIPAECGPFDQSRVGCAGSVIPVKEEIILLFLLGLLVFIVFVPDLAMAGVGATADMITPQDRSGRSGRQPQPLHKRSSRQQFGSSESRRALEQMSTLEIF